MSLLLICPCGEWEILNNTLLTKLFHVLFHLRFDDQVQFNLPKKFDDGFLTVPTEEVDEEEAAITGSSPSNKLNLPSQKVGQQPSQSVKRKPIKQNPVSSVENVNENKQNPVTSAKTRVTKHNPVTAAKTRVKSRLINYVINY